jgi:hypothetical protein
MLRFDPAGQFIGRAEFILGLLYKTKRGHVQLIEHLRRAKSILSQFGKSPLLERVEQSLLEMSA